MKVLPFGDAALLVELDDLDAVLALAAAVRAQQLDGVLDVVPAARTVLLMTEPRTSLDSLVARVTSLSSSTAPHQAVSEVAPVEITVVYDGPDLTEVARLTGLAEDEIVAAHTGTPWRIAFGGFAPGFAYLTGGDPRLSVPRRDEPRTTVPAGAVGLAGEYSGVYPRPSPGGWQLIGRTDAVLWDADRDPPALLAPGGSVRFRAAS
jgi:KipI family sensor histidine kinase inhibitor